MKIYKVPIYDPLNQDIIDYYDSYISEDGLQIISTILHIMYCLFGVYLWIKL